MELNEYQEKASGTGPKPDWDFIIPYMTLGLSGEAGEVADKIKKIYRDDNASVTPEHKEAIVKEMGDVLWYLSQLARALDTPLEEVAEKNLKKVYSRKEQGKLGGSGDDREKVAK